MAKNDWIVAGLNNPDFTPYDFSTIADMDLNNTQMLSADEYLKSDFIKNHDMFKDDNGNFSEDKFRKYHQHRLKDFQDFQEQEYTRGPQLDMFDTDRTKESRVKDIRFELGRHVNPDRQAIGIEGVRVWSDPTQTKSEIAQAQKIYDTKKGEFKDFSSNDKALSNGLFDWLGQVFSDPLVMAQWEEDGEHIDPMTGMLVSHTKGEYKLNDKGTYYYETLGDRNSIGKEVLSVFDTLTVDGEGINKYDFFDSDDIKKSVTGVIAKNVAALLPIFTPVGTAYSALLIAKEFSKALPMLYGWATALSDQQEAPKWINKVAAYGSKLSTGTSQYAKDNTFSFENFGNLIADVALQWGQQKAIAQAFNKIKGVDKYTDEALKSAKSLYEAKKATMGESAELWQACYNKFVPAAQKAATQAGQLGRDASLAYMAIVSNSDLYTDMRAMGLTNKEAAAISLGSTIGMFGLNKYTGLGEIFFDDATDDATKLARKAVKEEMGKAAGMFKNIAKSSEPEPNKFLKLINAASTKAQEVWSKFGDDLKYHTLGALGKAAGEGLEEVSEELISDVAKQMYELAGVFGVDTTLKDVGAWDNALERYTMSFVGGALGGGIFYGREAIMDGRSYKRDSKNWEIAHLIRNGHANELRAEIERLKQEGKLASTSLSASKYGEDESGNRVWLTTDKKADSQNDAVANAMLDKINAIEAVINNNRIGLTDEQLFENMVLTEQRYRRYEKVAGLTNYYQDFANIVNELIAAELDYKKASETIEGTVNGTPRTDVRLTPEQEAARTQQLEPLLQRIADLRKRKDDFLSGETSLEYTRKLNFIIDPILHSQFLDIDQGQFFREKYGDRRLEDLTPEELIKFQVEWQQKVEESLKVDVDKAWNRFKEVEALILPELATLAANTPAYKEFSSKTAAWINDDFGVGELIASYKKYDDKLDDESDEDYEARHSKKKRLVDTVDDLGNVTQVEVEESDAEFRMRQNARVRKIDAYNTQKDQEWADKVRGHLATVGYEVDPYTFRYIHRIMPHRQKDVVARKLSLALLPPNIRQIFKKLKPDLSNVEEIKQVVHDSIYEQSKAEVKSVISKITSLELYDDDGDRIDLNEYVTIEPDGDLTLRTIADNPDILDIQNPKLIAYLSALAPILGDDVTFSEVVQNGMIMVEGNPKIEEYSQRSVDYYVNQLGSLIADITSNPIYALAESVKVEVKNPIGELVKSLAAAHGDVIPNVDELLDFIQGDFEDIDNPEHLILDDTQMANLQKVKDYLRLIDGFIYAAASNPDVHNPVGHNQVINAFAKNHKEQLTKEWSILPEIDADYTALYNQAISQYVSEIDYWINLSNNNNVNKVRKFVMTDRAFNSALLDSIKGRDLKVIVDDREYNLLEGFVDGEEDPEINLFNAEQVLHRNFQLALQKSGLSVTEFLQKSGLLEKLIPSVKNIAKQRVAGLTDTLKKEDLTDFDLIQYFAQVFTLNPSVFYSELKGKVQKNTEIAPITAQEYSTKLAQAITSQQYRDIIRYAYEKSGSKLPYLGNTLIIPGVAGAGKTAVVLASVNNPDEEVILAGPTPTQGDKLKQSLGRTSFYTFDQVLEMILGKDQLIEIRTELGKVNYANGKHTFNGKYFTIENINDVPVIKLKKEAIKFKTLEKNPKKLFFDEATHLSALEIQILDAFAESIGAVNYMSGDPNQRGYFDPNSSIENLQEDQIFASRAPKLSISLRDNNLQKFTNQENVRALLDLVNDSVLDLSYEELQQFWPRALNTLSKFNFRVYNHDELNGDLITANLTPELIAKLKGGTIGFIGDNNSPYLKQLRDAGLEPKVLSMKEMQGEEFDFVVIDHNWEAPKADYKVKMFLTDLYTAMTRATTASIFIDNGLSSIIGSNIVSSNKSKAPSIRAGVDELRAKKLSMLERFNLDLSEIKAEEVADESIEKPSEEVEEPEPDTEDGTEPGDEEEEEEEEVEYTEAVSGNPSNDFNDPDAENIDPEISQVVEAIAEEDEKIVEQAELDNFTEDGEQIVETFTDLTILGVEKTPKQTRTIVVDGQQVTGEFPVWIIPPVTDGVARNLQALRPLFQNDVDPEAPVELVEYSRPGRGKIEAQKLLFGIKSCIIYQHDYSSLPAEVKSLITKSDWERGELEIEIREVGQYDVTHLNAKYDEVGFDYKGKRYIASVVFKVKMMDGNIAKFDISGLPSIDTYYKNLPIIKANLDARIRKATGEEKAKLQEKRNGVDATFAHYQQLLETWISDFEAGKFVPIKLDSSTINFNRTTWFQGIKKSARDAGLQLGGKVNPVTGENARDSLMLRHPELVFSPVYTFAAEKGVFDQVDQSLKGKKAVIFVTSDTTLKGDDLIKLYIEQKNNPESNTARIRMIVLDNYGMTFSQFIDKDFIKTFQRGDTTRKPFRQNFTGIRMFASLWNWRASLIKFNEALETWKTECGYSDAQVEILTRAAQMVYDGDNPDALLQSYRLTTNDLANLEKFNNEVCADVPIFRLGYSKNGNGFYVRGNVDVSSSSVYNKDKVNLLFITPDKAKQFEFLINRLLSAIEYTDDFGSENATLGLRLLKDDGSPWDKDELIDLQDAKHKRTLSNLLSSLYDKIILHSNGQNLEYDGGNNWSLIPAVLSNLVRTITYFQHNEDQIGNDVRQASIKLKNHEEEKYFLKTQIDDIFTQGYLKFGDDSSLFDLVNLIFHGTTDDIHKKLTKGESLLQVEDAYFKRGFFINPDASRIWDKERGDYVLEAVEDDDDNVIFYKIDTTPELFTVDTEVRTSGLGLRINEIYKNTQEEQSFEESIETTAEEAFKRDYPEISELIDDGIAQGIPNLTYDWRSAHEMVNLENKAVKQDIRSGILHQLSEVLDYTYELKISDKTLVRTTLRDYIASKIGTSDFTIDFGDKLIIKAGTSVYTMDNDFKIEKINETVVTEESIVDQVLSTGKTVKESIIEVIQDDNVRRDLQELYGIDESSLDQLQKAIKGIFKNSRPDSEIKEEFKNLLNNNQAYLFLSAYLEEVNPELSDILNKLCS